MKKFKLLIAAIALMPFIALSNPTASKAGADKEEQKAGDQQSEQSKQDKEAFLTRLLVKPVEQCRSWPLCD